MGGTPPSLSPVHVGYFNWLMTGVHTSVASSSAMVPYEFEGLTEPYGLDLAVARLVGLEKSPYGEASTNLVDPTRVGEPFDLYEQRVDAAIDYIDNMSSSESWSGYIVEFVQAIYDDSNIKPPYLGYVIPTITPSSYQVDFGTGPASSNYVVTATSIASCSITYSSISVVSDLKADLQSAIAGNVIDQMATINAAFARSGATFTSARLFAFNNAITRINKELAEKAIEIAKVKLEEAARNQSTSLEASKLNAQLDLEAKRTSADFALRASQGTEQLEFEGDKALSELTLRKDVEENRIQFDAARFLVETVTKEWSQLVDATVRSVPVIAGRELEKVRAMTDVARLAGATAELKQNLSQNYLDSWLRLEVEDVLWEAKAFKYAIEGIGSIGAAQVLPERPSPFLQFISTAAQIGSFVAQAM
jgi:hypothetical protein